MARETNYCTICGTQLQPISECENQIFWDDGSGVCSLCILKCRKMQSDYTAERSRKPKKKRKNYW